MNGDRGHLHRWANVSFGVVLKHHILFEVDGKIFESYIVGEVRSKKNKSPSNPTYESSTLITETRTLVWFAVHLEHFLKYLLSML